MAGGVRRNKNPTLRMWGTKQITYKTKKAKHGKEKNASKVPQAPGPPAKRLYKCNLLTLLFSPDSMISLTLVLTIVSIQRVACRSPLNK